MAQHLRRLLPGVEMIGGDARALPPLMPIVRYGQVGPVICVIPMVLLPPAKQGSCAVREAWTTLNIPPASVMRAAIFATGLALAGCATPSLVACGPAVARPAVFVANYGWHTEIIMPAMYLTGPLAVLRSPGTTALSFGFGKLDFFTVPDPAFGDFVRGTIPGPAAIRVVTLRVPPAVSSGSPVARLPLTEAGLATLQQFLAGAIARGPDGAPRTAFPPPDADTRFYAATSGYSLAYTCNSWVADGLDQAGARMGFGIVLSDGVMASVARVGGACAAN